mgnify:CR=1 FL=1
MISKALGSALRRQSQPPYANAEAATSPDVLRRLVHQAEQGQAEQLKATLAAAPGSAVDWTDAHGFTPLMHACTEGHVAVVRVLLDAGATVDICNPQRETGLHLVASIGYIDLVRLLVEHGANTSLKTATGLTAAGLAASLGHDSIVDFLGHGSVVGIGGGEVDAGAAAAAASAVDDGAADAVAPAGAGPPASEPQASDHREPRDAAFALLEADLDALNAEALDEIETVLQMTLERIGQLRQARAAGASTE